MKVYLKKIKRDINKKHILIGLCVIVASIVIDQLTKLLSLVYLDNGSITVIEGFFELKLYFNTGAAWSSFSGEFGFLMLMTLISIIAFAFFFKSVNFKTKLIYSLGISLMFGGLFGNMIDRIAMRKVVDFLSFDFGSYSFPIFNVADICLVVGVGLFIIDILFLEGKRKEKENVQLQNN